MSPVIARVAIRAANAAQRRQFSMMGSLRNFARSLESHPFERLPTSAKTQKADWSRQIKRVSSQAMIYFPGLGFILFWPALVPPMLNGKIGSL